MQPTVYQKPELRDANDNIIQQGAFGKNTALANSTNDGWIDYVANNLEFLYDLAKDEVVPVPSLPASGQTNKTYLLTTTGVSYRWSGTQWVAVSSSEAVGRAETAANLAEQWATKTDGTVDGTEYSAKYYAGLAEASADDAQDVADDMADHLVQIDKNTGGVAKNSKRISNIEKLLQGNLYDYDTDDGVAYTKTVPSGALPYAGIEMLGGKTLVWNQLVYNGDFAVDGGWYVTAGYAYAISNNSITVTKSAGTVSHLNVRNQNPYYPVNGHKYLLTSVLSTDNDAVIRFLIGGSLSNEHFLTSTPTRFSDILTASNSTAVPILYCQNNRITDGASITMTDFMCFDLTLMFGAGNEPSTVAEFEAMFPADYYPYNAGTLLSAGVTSVVSKDSNDDALQTLSIPAEVRALEGYGWSAGSVYNYIDFERKVFVKRVGRAVMNGVNYPISGVWSGSNPNGTAAYTSYLPFTHHAVAISDRFIKSSSSQSSMPLMTFGGTSGTGTTNTFILPSTVTGVASANQWFANNPTTFYYPLTTPVETDISAYLTDNLIEVGAGGTLTFENSNGDDYHIPVPSTETYMIDLQEAISNG